MSVATFAGIVLAPFYLVFTGHSSFDKMKVIPIYTKTIEECQAQALIVEGVMQGRSATSFGRWISNGNNHAFCIATGWTPDKTNGETMSPDYSDNNNKITER